MFALPSKGTLMNFLNKIPFKTGIDKIIFDVLEPSVRKMKVHERFCAVLFDEMSLSINTQYDSKEDCIEGIHDDGMLRKPLLADYANEVFIKGIFRRWKQPIAYTFSSGASKGLELKKIIINVIRECRRIGLRVICSICDQGQNNQAAINSLLKDTADECKRHNVSNCHHGYLIDGEKIVHIYDIPHVFKGIRNNLLTKDLCFEINSQKKVAKLEHIIEFYYLDMEEENRICPTSTAGHVLPEKMNKMKVSHCTQVFSNKVGCLMDRIAKWDIKGAQNLPTEACDTAELILLLDKLFDSCNSHCKLAPSSKRVLVRTIISSEIYEERLQKLTEENTQLKRRNKNLRQACNRKKKRVEILKKRLPKQIRPDNDAISIETRQCDDTPLTKSNSFLEETLPNVSMTEKEKAISLKKLGLLQTSDIDELMKNVTCSKCFKCMYSECSGCKNKKLAVDLTINEDSPVEWLQWKMGTHTYIKIDKKKCVEKQTKKYSKQVVKGTVNTLIKEFQNDVQKFKTYYYNVQHQYLAWKKCITLMKTKLH
ncbi:unnamed protein product [Arctia plantaginis]|uniref:Transposase n=1 Tax=Arctia plantaginis TaxID=874455 RepID=A0A8S1AVF5_ARCPL|nr:unnamed protein product [Arctia plantaginis]